MLNSSKYLEKEMIKVSSGSAKNPIMALDTCWF